MADTGIDWFCQHAYPAGTPPPALVLDVESTDDATQGAVFDEA